MANWPTQTVLPIKVELLLNGVWTDISSYVYQRDDIVITGGGSEQAKKPQPAQCTMTLNNQDARFSPTNPSGAYFPYLVRNVQIRVSINGVTSVTGNNYNGFRFWGKVADWPPTGDRSGTDIYCQITANGPLREVNKGGGKGSALVRYYDSLTGLQAPVAYWACEEDPDTNQVQSSLQGGTSMTISGGTPTWKTISNFNGSAPIGVLNGSTWTGLTGSFGGTGDDVFNVPGTYQWIASTSTVDCIVLGGGGGGGGGFVNPHTSNTFGGGGGGAEYAEEATLAVTPGNIYNLTVGAGGQAGSAGKTGGSAATAGGNGGLSSFTGDSVTATAHGGSGGGAATSGSNGGAGSAGSGSSNTVHHSGGAGVAGQNSIVPLYGGGGGGSGGSAAAGNPGSTFNGGTAVTGGGPGGAGAQSGAGSTPSSGYGGGGGGGSAASGSSSSFPGGNGFSGKVELKYTPSTGAPPANVLRFILFVPKHGGNANRVLCQMLTGGTIVTLKVIYGNGGQIKFQAFNSTPALIFDTGYQSFNVDNRTVMISIELIQNGTSINWALRAIDPGATSLIGSATGTQASISLGNVSEVQVAPNGDITKTAMGHFSIQYALVPLLTVSDGIADALNGHNGEATVDRWIRLLGEQAIGAEPHFAEGSDHWGFESGTQSWTGVSNVALTQSSVSVAGNPNWPAEGSFSLLATCSGAGVSVWSSPRGTSGQQCTPGDIVSNHFDVYTPVALTGTLNCRTDYFTISGTAIAGGSNTVTFSTTSGQIQTVRVTGKAPATAAFFCATLATTGTEPANRLVYADNIRVAARMGPQTRKYLKDWLEEVKDLEQAMYADSKILYGVKFRTRVSLLNQTPAVTLSYTSSHMDQQLAPVYDDLHIQNDITVRRHKGSKIRVTDSATSQQPPVGTGPYKKEVKVIAEVDDQLAALAAHILNLGKDVSERYPTISVNLARPEVATIMSVIAAADVGDYVQLTNLPSWLPSSTAKQLITGYTETLNAYTWQIVWNCVPELPFEITSYRRW